jgi:hypothetical protein
VLSEVGGAREQIADDPDHGYLVSNPLGDPIAVTWESLAAARFRPQVNREELATAMDQLVIDRERYLDNRQCLAAKSAKRFSANVCLEGHAAVLRAVATGADLPGSPGVKVASVADLRAHESLRPVLGHERRQSTDGLEHFRRELGIINLEAEPGFDLGGNHHDR